MRRLLKFSKIRRTQFALLAALLVATLPWIGFSWPWLAVAALMHFYYIGMGASVGLHRYWAHGSYQTTRAWEYVMILAGVLGMVGIPMGFVHVHRLHHRHSDTGKDPHRLHVNGWRSIYRHYDTSVPPRIYKRFMSDPLHRITYEWFFGIILLFITLLFVLGGLKAIVYVWALPTLFGHLLRKFWFIYSIHKWGYRNFEIAGDTSRNNWWIALLTFGEGWHNNHHAHPVSYSFKRRWWELDPGAIVVNLIRTDKSNG